MEWRLKHDAIRDTLVLTKVILTAARLHEFAAQRALNRFKLSLRLENAGKHSTYVFKFIKLHFQSAFLVLHVLIVLQFLFSHFSRPLQQRRFC